MARTYNDYLNLAATHKRELDNLEQTRRDLQQRIANNQSVDPNQLESVNRDIILCRGRYISNLRRAYALNPTASIPPAVTGQATNVRLYLEIQNQLIEHQNQIDIRLRRNKAQSNINRPTLTKELNLKIERLKSRIHQRQQARNSVRGSDIEKDSLGIVGTAVKAPIMIATKIISKLGPLAITIVALPATLLASLLAVTFDISEKRPTNKDYNNTVVHQMSNALKDGVVKISNSIYQATGRI